MKSIKKLLKAALAIGIGIMIGLIYFNNFYYEKPDKVLSAALEALSEGDENAAKQYMDVSLFYDHAENEAIDTLIMRDFSYTINRVSSWSPLDKQPEVTAELNVTNRNLEEIYGKFVIDAYEKVISSNYAQKRDPEDEAVLKEQIDTLLLNNLSDGVSMPVTSTIEVQMKQTGRSWYIYFDADDVDAIKGHYLTAIESADNVLGDLSVEALQNLENTYNGQIDDASHELRNAAHYVTDKIWNDTLCNIVSCINAGTDMKGDDYDLPDGLKKLKQLIKEKVIYDDYIARLDTDLYADIIKSWQFMSDALNALMDELEAQSPEPLDYDYLPDTTNFEKYLNQFVKLVYPDSVSETKAETEKEDK